MADTQPLIALTKLLGGEHDLGSPLLDDALLIMIDSSQPI
ncbi:MAG: hypothetical protein QOJ64_1351 [Acidobacteriota bacterium]|jgi:hypothetical protein|nr:hypothetical protein [Acidobacteriota bacterium]